MGVMAPDWSCPAGLPTIRSCGWEINGLIIDIRRSPPELHRLAYEKGVIPFIPAVTRDVFELVPPMHAPIARALFGKRTVYVEVYDRIDSATMTGRLCYPFSNLFLLQWEEQRRSYPKGVVIGSLL